MQGKNLDRYQLGRALGRGAMGTVYLARDPKLGRDVALKLLDAEWAKQRKARERFEREARAIAALRHPNIVDIYDCSGPDSERLYLVMELLTGVDAGALCRKSGRVTESVASAIGHELATALAHAHARGLIHRDLKPENVFIEDGRVVLTDFGIVKGILADSPLGPQAAGAATDVIGTPGFMAPEQVASDPIDARTDLFALGALMYWLVSTKLPFQGASLYELAQSFTQGAAPPIATHCPTINPRLAKLINACLAVEPSGRPTSAEAVRGELRAVLDELAVRDVRELLKEFVANPVAFRSQDHRRITEHTAGHFKAALRDGDLVGGERWRALLTSLDPTHPDLHRATAMELFPVRERGVRRSSRRWLAGLALGLIAAALAVVAGNQLTARSRTRSAPAAPSSPVAVLEVRGADGTGAFLDGQALGQMPGLAPAVVQSGRHLLELSHPLHGNLQRELVLAPDQRTIVTVNWRRRLVRVAVEPP